MISLGKKPLGILPFRRNPGADRRRRVRAAPRVVPLEDRALLSGAGVHGAVGARGVPAAEVRADRAFVTSLYHHLLHMAPPPASTARWVRLLEAKMTPEQVRLAFLASRQYRRLLAIEQSRASARGRPGLGSHGIGLVGANAGAGPSPSGYLGGFDHGTAVDGANPGGGPVPSGYLGGFDHGTAIDGANPGGGPVPSGYLGG
jgi:hypothetical protein